MRCPEELAKENTDEPFKNYQRMRCLEESTKGNTGELFEIYWNNKTCQASAASKQCLPSWE
jgi:hypothetical protein